MSNKFLVISAFSALVIFVLYDLYFYEGDPSLSEFGSLTTTVERSPYEIKIKMEENINEFDGTLSILTENFSYNKVKKTSLRMQTISF